MPFANGKAIHSFGHGITPINAASDLFYVSNGAMTIQIGGGRLGGNALRSTHTGGSPGTPANTTIGWYQNSSSAQATTDRQIISVYARYITKPASGTISFWTLTTNGGSNMICRLDTGTGKWIIFIGTGTTVDTGVTPITGVWYRFDIVYRQDLNPRTGTVYITQDGDSTYLAQVNCTGPTETPQGGKWFVCGGLSGIDQVCEFSDLLMSGNAAASGDGDFPITPQGYHHHVIPVFPLADGTHAVGTGTFRYTDNNGGAFTNMTNGTTDSWSRVDEWPPIADANGADDWVEKQLGTTGTDRVEWAFGNPYFNGTPLAVHTHAAVKASTTAAGSCELYQREGTTDAATQINSGTVGSTTTVYRGACYPLAPDGTAWNAAHLVGQKVRFSSTVVSPISQVKSVYMDVAYQYQPAVPLALSTVATASR